MDDLNITMEEYIMLEEEKAQKREKVFNWETAKYGKIWYDEDIHDLRSVETELPTITFNDRVSSCETLSCEPTVSSINHETDFRISFDDSDDEDYMVVFEKNSFSYKIISTNELKKDSENDNEKVMPLLPLPEPTSFIFENCSNYGVLGEYSKRRAFWSLNDDILKITILITNMSYPSRKIRLIRACTHQRPQRKEDQYAVSREDQYAVLDI
ncbi:hypothetical protein Tco_1317121 [Tanacetum coccineum]